MGWGAQVDSAGVKRSNGREGGEWVSISMTLRLTAERGSVKVDGAEVDREGGGVVGAGVDGVVIGYRNRECRKCFWGA